MGQKPNGPGSFRLRGAFIVPEPGKGSGMVSSRGGKHGYVHASRHRVYRALRRKGMSKTKAARISNAGITSGARSRMARKAARTRRSRKG